MTDTLKTISPVDGRIYVERPLHTAADIDRALDAARAAQLAWSRVPLAARCECWARPSMPSSPRRTTLPPKSPGRWDARFVMPPARCAASRSARATCCGWRRRRSPRCDPATKAGFERQIKRVPLGVVAVVAPWNYPYLTAVNAVLPALIAGNTVVLKHSHQTPLCAERFLEAFAGAGVPSGVFQYLHLSHADTARLMGDRARRQRVFYRLGGRRARGGRGHRGRFCHLRPRARRQGSGLCARRREPRARDRDLDGRRLLQRRPVLLRHQAHLCRGVALRRFRRRRRRPDPEVSAGIAARSRDDLGAGGAHFRCRGGTRPSARGGRARGASAHRRGVVRGLRAGNAVPRAAGAGRRGSFHGHHARRNLRPRGRHHAGRVGRGGDSADE